MWEANAIAQRPSWVLLDQDALAQLWGRRERYDDIASPDFISSDTRVIGDEEQSGYLPWTALPAQHAGRT